MLSQAPIWNASRDREDPEISPKVARVDVQLTTEQSEALGMIVAFLRTDTQDAFILRGSAGTGKTTLIAKLVDELAIMNVTCALLAPTGRAARILGNKIMQISGKASLSSSTIHRAIYALAEIEINEEAETASDPGVRMIFPLKQDEARESLFIIDESSMIGDKESTGDTMQFGSGRLLADIVTYARANRPGQPNNHRTRLLFVGDPAQLPPVGENDSPALSRNYLERAFGLQVASFDLTTVMRQSQGSAILDRATELRDAVLANRVNHFSLRPNGHDIEQVDSGTALDRLVDGLKARDSNVAVVGSNAMALRYNRSIRERQWGDAHLPIQVSETLLVNRNSSLHPVSNGDLVKVMQVDKAATHVTVHLRGGHNVDLRFRDVTVAYRDGDGSMIQFHCIVLENLLDAPTRDLTPLEQRALLVDFRKRHPHLHPKSADFRRTIRSDPYFNALHVKFGYAMTCHKAQGGEWNTVIVDFESQTGVRNPAQFRWAYTAITRAAKKLIVVNPPAFTDISSMAWGQPPGTTTDVIPRDDQDVARDPDWNRLSFSAATAHLLPTHRRLRAAWQSRGIAIERLQHLQHCERYGLARDADRVTVHYYYDKKYRVTRGGIAGSAPAEAQLAADALAPIAELTDDRGGEGLPNPFVERFLGRLDAAIATSSIRRTGHRTMPYRLRVSFSNMHHNGEIDFTFDATNTWTSAQEVGGPGASRGLYEEVQSCLHTNPEGAQ
jgi:hypothetical protein